jgi:DNA-binding SARP family transcriptional activator
MSRRPRLVAWSLAAIAIVLFALGVILDTLGSSTRGPHLETTDIALFVAFLSYALVGALVASRQPGNPIGWLLLAEGLLFQLVPFSIGYVRFALYDANLHDGTGHGGGAAFVAWVGDSVWIPVLVVAAFIFLVFPTGHLLSRRWRLVAGVGLALAVVGFASEAFRPGPMGGSLSDLDNPVGIRGADEVLSTVGAVSTAVAGPLLLGGALLSFLMRFRAADGTLRQQLHWLAYAALVLVGGFILGDVLKTLGIPSSVYGLCYLLPLAGVPVAIGIAILRHRLYEIQVVIDGTVIAAAVAGFAVAVYGVLVVGVGAVVGNRTGSNVVLASIATAVVAFAFPVVLGRARSIGRRIAYGAPSPHELETGVALRCLGAFRVFRDGNPVPATAWQSKKARSLLKILVARRGRSTPRAMLMEMLWPDDDPAKLANRLSVALATVRAVLDPDKTHPADHYISAEKDAMRLDLERVAVDVEDFLAGAGSALSLVRDGRPTEGEGGLTVAAAMYAGDFLEEDLYEDWSHDLRDEARAVYIEVVRSLAEISREAGHPDAAIVHYLRLLAKDPWDEGAHIGLVRTLDGSGRRGEARRHYRGYAARMDELDLPVAAFPT